MQDIGVVSLAVMGRNLALNFEEKGCSVSVFNRTPRVTDEFVSGEAKGKKITGFKDLAGFVASLERPRRILLMVKSGPPVDEMIGQLKPLLEKNDILVDGGNSHFGDTERREKELGVLGIRFVGMGVSGGEEGARHGPSLMPGGSAEAYARLEPILSKIAARTEAGPCLAHAGRGGAGHFVKMVHNGIEYGDLELIAESYDLLKRGLALSTSEIASIFCEWNKGALESYLIEITSRIVNVSDDLGGGVSLVERILDKAGEKGTGKWTVAAALDERVAVPTITAALDARFLSMAKEERVRAAGLFKGLKRPLKYKPDASFAQKIQGALYASKICAYAQGFALLAAADRTHAFGLKLDEIARIWKGGCIIRAKLLDPIRKAFGQNPALPNLMLDPGLASELGKNHDAWREVITFAHVAGIPVMAMSASFSYFGAYAAERMPVALIQALRDYFGAHTYERTDRPGTFHTDWP